VKVWKCHTLVFRCPVCAKESDYALQIVDGPNKGTQWDPSYVCEKCNTPVRARDKWLYGAVFGPLMAIIGTFAVEALPPGLHAPQWAALAFAILCCAIVGWPLSRTLSRHLVFWEPRDPVALRQARLRRLREDDE
jgi:hypothetical protein